MLCFRITNKYFAYQIEDLGKVHIFMDRKKDILEYIANLTFKKKWFGGVDSKKVYDAIDELSSMYDRLLSDVYMENEQLKKQVEEAGSSWISTEMSEKENERRRNLDILFSGEPEEVKMLTENDLRKLKRIDLLELLLVQVKRNDEQKKQIKELVQEIEGFERKLADKRIIIDQAGTIAEASFQLNGIFEVAERAAQQYLDNLQLLYNREEENCVLKEQKYEIRCAAMEQTAKERCELMKEEVEQKCREIEENTRIKCEAREREAEERCAALDQKAKMDVEKRWDELSVKLEEFYLAHKGLKELLTMNGDLQRY